MRKLLLLLIVLSSIAASSQQWSLPVSNHQRIAGLWAERRLKLPADTSFTKEAGCVTLINGVLYFADGTRWNIYASGGGTSAGVSSFDGRNGDVVPQAGDYTISMIPGLLDSIAILRSALTSTKTRFVSNVVVNGSSSDKLGVWANGETIPLAGKPLDSLPYILATKAIAPNYVSPTVSVSATPTPGNYERGTNLGTITLSRTFTQNDAGALSGDTYGKYISTWNNLVGNTDAITSLTQATYYRVTTSYGQGPCKNNNVGQQDCTGRIQAGSVTSSNIFYIPFDKRYWGFASSTAPSNSTILALTQDNNGATGSLSLSNVTPSGSQYFVYFTKGNVSSITVNGFPATEAFTITTYTVTNAQGFASTYTYVYSNNLQTGTISSIVIN